MMGLCCGRLQTLFHCCAAAETTDFVPLLCSCRDYRLCSKRLHTLFHWCAPAETTDFVPLLCCCRDYGLCSIVVLLQRLQSLFHCCAAAETTDFIPRDQTVFHCCAAAETTDSVPLLCSCRDYRLCSIVVLLHRIQTLFQCCMLPM